MSKLDKLEKAVIEYGEARFLAGQNKPSRPWRAAAINVGVFVASFALLYGLGLSPETAARVSVVPYLLLVGVGFPLGLVVLGLIGCLSRIVVDIRADEVAAEAVKAGALTDDEIAGLRERLKGRS